MGQFDINKKIILYRRRIMCSCTVDEKKEKLGGIFGDLGHLIDDIGNDVIHVFRGTHVDQATEDKVTKSVSIPGLIKAAENIKNLAAAVHEASKLDCINVSGEGDLKLKICGYELDISVHKIEEGK
jgi:hypothetical protein